MWVAQCDAWIAGADPSITGALVSGAAWASGVALKANPLTSRAVQAKLDISRFFIMFSFLFETVIHRAGFLANGGLPDFPVIPISTRNHISRAYPPPHPSVN